MNIDNKMKENNPKLSPVSFIMMPKEKESNNLVYFINSEFKNKTFEDMNSSFSSQIVLHRFIMRGVNNDFIDFVFKNFSQDGVFPASFVNLSFAQWLNLPDVSHFDSSKISETELNLIEGSFNAFFNSLMCSGLGGNSSTGCQSIFSQNSQSSSVISRVCLYLLNISRFINLTTDLANNLWSNLNSSLGLTNSGILSSQYEDSRNGYLNVLENGDFDNIMLERGGIR